MPTIAIFEAYGVKYDQYFDTPKQAAADEIKKLSDTAHIHYIEEVNNTKLSQPRKILIIT